MNKMALSSSRTMIPENLSSMMLTEVENSNPKWNQYMNLDKAKNAIKVIGEPVTKVIETLKDIDPCGEALVKGSVVKIRMDVFDELDEIVFSYLRDAYYDTFKQSFWWTKHFQYLCIAEMKVVEDDFAIFRGRFSPPICIIFMSVIHYFLIYVIFKIIDFDFATAIFFFSIIFFIFHFSFFIFHLSLFAASSTAS